VRISSEDGTTTHVSIPVSVARRLTKMQREHELPNPIEQSRLMEVMQALMRDTATQLVYRLLAKRDYSVLEVRKRLSAEGFPEDVERRTVQHFMDAGLLSNQRFADAFIRSKMSAGLGMKRIAYELTKRGVDVDELTGWPYAYACPDEERARALAVALRKTVREPNAYAKMVRFLSGRGFSIAVSRSVAREVVLES
jgi:regulatory protein